VALFDSEMGLLQASKRLTGMALGLGSGALKLRLSGLFRHISGLAAPLRPVFFRYKFFNL
jgi:hypothetical protein